MSKIRTAPDLPQSGQDDANRPAARVTGAAVEKPALKILLSAPRGFCAGVERAIEIVEKSLEKYGAPVYVRHEIVHNRHVVEDLEGKGAVFVKELDEVPPGKPVIFSAHGVPKSVPNDAQDRKLFYLDATCPLVSKVHVEAERHYRNGKDILLIGHDGHPEVIGTMGQLPEGAIRLVETPADAEAIEVADPDNLAFITQTTLSVDETEEIVQVFKRRFPTIAGPHKEDICYATTNRQEAVKAIAEQCDAVLVVGSPNSSNSCRLVEVAKKAGARQSMLVQTPDDLDWQALEGASTIGLTAGASAPELLVQNIVDAFRDAFEVELHEVQVTKEEVHFKLPRVLTA